MKQVVVIAGPAGSGKDTLAKELVRRFDNMSLMVTATTRAKRPTEMEGVNYYFLTKEKFQEELKKGNILEYYHRPETDTYYGTYKLDLDMRLESGKIVIAVIQIVGAKYLKERYNATTLFIMPPSLDAFERRLRARSPMSEAGGRRPGRRPLGRGRRAPEKRDRSRGAETEAAVLIRDRPPGLAHPFAAPGRPPPRNRPGGWPVEARNA